VAAGLWTRAFDVKKASLVGADPAAALTKAEAKEEAGSPGCNEALLPYAEQGSLGCPHQRQCPLAGRHHL
jgi:hypothetical protein